MTRKQMDAAALSYLGRAEGEQARRLLYTLLGLEEPEAFARRRRAANLAHDERWFRPNCQTGRTTDAVLLAVYTLLRAKPDAVVKIRDDHTQAGRLRQLMFTALGRLGWPHEEIARRVVWARRSHLQPEACYLADHYDTTLLHDYDVHLPLRGHRWRATLTPLGDLDLHQAGADRGWRFTWETPLRGDDEARPRGTILWWKEPQRAEGPKGGRPSRWRFTCDNDTGATFGGFNVQHPFLALREAVQAAMDGRSYGRRGPRAGPRAQLVEELLVRARALPESGTLSRRALARALGRPADDYAARQVFNHLRRERPGPTRKGPDHHEEAGASGDC